MRLIFPETRPPGLQFEHKNKAILIRIEKIHDFSKLVLKTVTGATEKPRF